ncbi:hypothetical protein WN48_11253 [Eufriesea mexicana]|uniref:Uncharacterized protein n=1 Tax=Eufriesea mexicana TaxID=516756 RepID=A0A310SD28_9HYME|nr:hypothetical protein WN48_11253 [Eufriesea mexicana]
MAHNHDYREMILETGWANEVARGRGKGWSRTRREEGWSRREEDEDDVDSNGDGPLNAQRGTLYPSADPSLDCIKAFPK